MSENICKSLNVAGKGYSIPLILKLAPPISKNIPYPPSISPTPFHIHPHYPHPYVQPHPYPPSHTYHPPSTHPTSLESSTPPIKAIPHVTFFGTHK